jgi:hypothetical protein
MKINAATPCIVERKGWSGVVLANPVPIGIDKASEVVNYFVQRAPSSQNGKQLILVVGTEGELRRILHRFPGEQFNAVPFSHFLSREWEDRIETVKTAADASLAAGKPELAYKWLIEAVGLFNELYFHPMMREALELAVLAAGERIPPNLREPCTPAEDFAQVRASLEPYVPRTPRWFDRAYLCFYEDEQNFEGPPASFASELSRLDDGGEVKFARNELHLIVTAYPQAIVRQAVPLLERTTLDMLALVMLGELSRHGVKISESDHRFIATVFSTFRLSWDKLLNSTERYKIYKQYQRLTNGKDIMLEWNLPSHGLTFTIDRMESGGDPPF